MLRVQCNNDNHGRSVVTVRFCPSCGAVVNEKIFAIGCPVEKHARMRRARSTYCMDCGEGLVQKQSFR